MSYEVIKDGLRESYNRRVDERDGMRDRDWKAAERSRFRELMAAQGVETLLEIGAGHGVSGRFFVDQGLSVTCVDLSPELVERCRAKGLDAHVMDFGDLAFPDGSFDAVWGMNCLLHVPRAQLPAVLTEVRRVLQPGGLFYWGQYGGHEFEGVYSGDSYEPKRFFSFMDDTTIRRIAAKYFDVVDFRATAPDGTDLGYQALVARRANESSYSDSTSSRA